MKIEMNQITLNIVRAEHWSRMYVASYGRGNNLHTEALEIADEALDIFDQRFTAAPDPEKGRIMCGATPNAPMAEPPRPRSHIPDMNGDSALQTFLKTCQGEGREIRIDSVTIDLQELIDDALAKGYVEFADVPCDPEDGHRQMFTLTDAGYEHADEIPF